MMKFHSFIALPLTGESFDHMMKFQGFLALLLTEESFKICV